MWVGAVAPWCLWRHMTAAVVTDDHQSPSSLYFVYDTRWLADVPSFASALTYLFKRFTVAHIDKAQLIAVCMTHDEICTFLSSLEDILVSIAVRPVFWFISCRHILIAWILSLCFTENFNIFYLRMLTSTLTTTLNAVHRSWFWRDLFFVFHFTDLIVWTRYSGVARFCMQKLLDFSRRQLSTYSHCQTLYRSKCTEKKLNCCKSRGHMPQCPIAGDANDTLWLTHGHVMERFCLVELFSFLLFRLPVYHCGE